MKSLWMGCLEKFFNLFSTKYLNEYKNLSCSKYSTSAATLKWLFPLLLVWCADYGGFVWHCWSLLGCRLGGCQRWSSPWIMQGCKNAGKYAYFPCHWYLPAFMAFMANMVANMAYMVNSTDSYQICLVQQQQRSSRLDLFASPWWLVVVVYFRCVKLNFRTYNEQLCSNF